MKTVIVYEPVDGSTQLVAREIAGVAGEFGEVVLTPVSDAVPTTIDDSDLLIVGGPTHVSGLLRPINHREAASKAATRSDLDLDPKAEGPRLRNWLRQLGDVDHVSAATFDIRLPTSSLLTGRASTDISRILRHHGFHEVVGPESFLVDKDNCLIEGQVGRARAWAKSLFRQLGCRSRNS